MRKPFAATMALVLILGSTSPGVRPAFPHAASAYAPPPPTLPAPTPSPEEPDIAGHPLPIPPSPGDLHPEAEETRARQAIEAVLEKYLRYWGPRYQAAPVEMAVEGEWAHGVAQWRSQTRTLKEPIHILAHRLPDGTWQALMPSSEGLYLQWVDAVPESLVPAGEKSQLRAQAAEADAAQRAVKPPMIITPTTPSSHPLLPSESLDRIAPAPTPVPLPQPETWVAEETSVSRLGEEERTMLCGVPVEVIEWERLQASREPADPEAVYDYPSAKDWRDVNGQDWTTAIRSQGGCGSCVAFGTIAAIESRMEIVNGNPGLNPDLAEAHLFFCNGRQCNPGDPNYGWWPDAAMNYAHDTGIVDEACYPYADHNQSCNLCADWQSRVTKITSWTGTSSVAEMKQALADHGPLEATMAVYGDFYSYLGGIYHHTWGTLEGYHAVTIVGYDDGGGYWIVKNSWGTGWGEDEYGNPYGGWFRIAYGECEIDDYGYIPVVPGGDEQVRLYGLANYEGDIVFSGGTGFSNDPNADSYSMEIPSGWSVRTWRGDNRTGEERCWSELVPNLQDHGWHLAIQSIEVFDYDDCPPGQQVKLYELANYQGSVVFSRGTGFSNDPNADSYSMEIPSGWSVRTWRGDNRTGEERCWSESVSNLQDHGWHLAIQSVEVLDYDDCPSICNPNADQVALYADTGYGGSCVTLDIGDYPNPGYLGSLGNDNAESVRVGSNVQATLCEHDDYQGRCETFTSDDSNLGDNYIGANVVSSVRVQSRTQPPSAPTLQSPGNGSTHNEGTSLTLAWNNVTGATEYYAEYWGGPAGTLNSGWQSGTSWYIGSQWAGYTYSWHVKARNDAGESGWSDTWTFTVKPAAPSNLSGQTASCSQINLYWNDNSGNEEGYKIYRNGSYVGQVGMNTTSYQDTGLGENISYSYYVKAFRGSIESDPSNTVNITTPLCVPPQPDLVPSQWGGWSYPIVPSSITGTTEVNTLYANYPTYIDWGISNSGDADCGGDAYGDLYIDDTLLAHYNFGDVQAGWTWAFFDWPSIIVDTPGWHTLKFVADIDDLIAESDENNNAWQRDFYWTPSAPYADDMESGINDWTATSLWHQVDQYTSPYPESHSWSHSWWYGQDATGDYDTGTANSGDLTSPPVYIPSTGYYLRFWYRYETETQGQSWDQRWGQISVDGGPFNNVLQLYDDPMNWWLQSPVIDLSGYAGHTIQVRFHFDTLDAYFNDYRGWYIDDFDISTMPPPINCADSHEPNDAPAEATAIAYGQTLNANICPGGDYDFYTFSGTAGDKVVIDIDAKVNGSLLDSYVYLLDSDGTSVLAEHDDEIVYEVQDSHLGYQLPHDGTYYVKVKAWDHPSAGSADHFYTIHLLTDDVSPTAEITLPGHDSWLDPNLQIVTTDVNDDESGIRNVTFYWHDADWDNPDWIVLEDDWDPRDGWTYEFETSSIPEQPQDCVVFIYAYDWAGNYAGYGSYHLGIDRTPPTVTAGVQQMYGDAPFRDFWATWWNGSDNLSGIASYDVQYRDGAGGTWTNLVISTTEVYTRFVGLDGHTYYFRACARDYAGNQSTYIGGDGDVQYTVNICDTPPDAYEVDNAYSSAKWITTDGVSQSHNIHAEGDEDWVKFYAAAGVTYTLATTNTGGHADTVLYLYDTDGSTLIDFNDDYPGMWPSSRLDWQPSSSGIYYSKVDHWDPWAYGCTTEYGLSIVTNDETPPSGSVSINDGATYAASTAVALNLVGTDVGTGVDQVMISNSSDFSGATWVAYATSLNWTLTAGDGTKTVYVKFRDRAGNESAIYSDTIILDTTAPTGSILIQGGAEVVTDTQVALTLSASDAHGVTHMRLRNDTAAWGAWEPFAASRTWTLPDQEGQHTVWVQFRDPAVNVSVAYSDSVAYQLPHPVPDSYYVHLPLVLRGHP